jgi:hypothetical protein
MADKLTCIQFSFIFTPLKINKKNNQMASASPKSIKNQINELVWKHRKLVIKYPPSEDKVDLVVSQALTTATCVRGRNVYILTRTVASHKAFKDCFKNKADKSKVKFLSTPRHPFHMIYHHDDGQHSKIFLHSIRHPSLGRFWLTDIIIADGGSISKDVYKQCIYWNFFFTGGLRKTIYSCETDTLEYESSLHKDKYEFATIKAEQLAP